MNMMEDPDSDDQIPIAIAESKAIALLRLIRRHGRVKDKKQVLQDFETFKADYNGPDQVPVPKTITGPSKVGHNQTEDHRGSSSTQTQWS